MSFKKFCAGLSAIVAISAAPAFAETVQSGYVGGAFQNATSDGEDVQVYSLHGAAAIPLSGNWGMQFNGEYDRLDSDLVEGDGFGGTAHLFKRNDKHLFGVFAGVGDSEDTTSYGGGAQADLFTDRWTIGGRVSYLTQDDGVDADVWSGEFRLKRFFGERVSLAGSVAVDNFNVDAVGVDDFNTYTTGASVEYQFANAPISMTYGLSYAEVDDVGETLAGQIGIRYHFGGLSVKERDRKGASLASFGSRLAGVE